MKCRVLWLSLTLAAIAVLVFGIQGSDAKIIGKTGRYKLVEIESLQYVWELVSTRDGRVICQVIVDHATRPTNEETISICANEIFPPEPTPTPLASLTPDPAGTPVPAGTPAAGDRLSPTPTEPGEPFNLAAFFRAASWRFVRTQLINRSIKVYLPDLLVNLSVPSRPTDPLYATLSAYEPVYGERIEAIYGTLDGHEFYCPSNRCDVPINNDSVIEFWAVSSLGDESYRVRGTLRRALTDKGLVLKVEALSPVTIFQDSCGMVWNVDRPTDTEWAKYPLTPDELNTQKPYQFLAGRLIGAGLVDTTGCPGGGLYGEGAPNACGLEKAGPAVIEWQNQYDMAIWTAGRDLGIPPRLIKLLIEQESQFWPGNGRNVISEFGLGQLSQVGVDVLLRWDNELFEELCSTLLYDCSLSYGRMPSWLQATTRGGLLRAYNVECANCPNGIDLARSYDTIPVITRALRANCRQVKFLMDRKGGGSTNASYEDLWKLTFASYHSGYQCIANALDYVSYYRYPKEWPYLSGFLDCGGANSYVNTIWKSLSEFESYRIKHPESSKPVNPVVFSPKPAPTLTPTPVLSLAHIRVMVYMDANRNALPDPDERLKDVRVEARFSDGSVVSAITDARGEAIIDMTGRLIDRVVVVSLPELFREQRIVTPRDGEIPVLFRLEQPVVPPGLP